MVSGSRGRPRSAGNGSSSFRTDSVAGTVSHTSDFEFTVCARLNTPARARRATWMAVFGAMSRARIAVKSPAVVCTVTESLSMIAALRRASSREVGFMNSGSSSPRKTDAIESALFPLVLLYTLSNSYLWSAYSAMPSRLVNVSTCASPTPLVGFVARDCRTTLPVVMSRTESDSANGCKCTAA